MLTQAQLATLKATVEADASVAAALADGNYGAIADAYNANSTAIVWRTSVSQDEIMQNGFDWTRVDNLSIGKARVWEWLFNNEGRSINPSKANVRAGIDQTWAGTQADLNVRAAVYVHCKRPATRFEALYASGAGTEATPATLGFGVGGMAIEGELSVTMLAQALRG